MEVVLLFRTPASSVSDMSATSLLDNGIYSVVVVAQTNQFMVSQGKQKRR